MPKQSPRPSRVKAWTPAEDGTTDELWICDPPSWGAPAGTWSIKRGHRIPGGNWQRAGEVPGAGFPMRAIELAYQEGLYSTEQVLGHIKRLLDLIAEQPPAD